MLRVTPAEIADRLLAEPSSTELEALVRGMDDSELAPGIRDLGGHDIGLLLDTYASADPDRPTVVFAYTIKASGLGSRRAPEQSLGAAQRGAVASSRPKLGRMPRIRGGASTRTRREATSAEARDSARRPLADGAAGSSHRHRPAPTRPTSTQQAFGRFLVTCTRARAGRCERVVDVSARRRVVDEPRRLDQQDRIWA